VAAGFLNFSLISALMAVYYSTTQYRILGRLLQAEQVRLWIRGGRRNEYASERIVPSLFQMIEKRRRQNPNSNLNAATSAPASENTWLDRSMYLSSPGLIGVIMVLIRKGPAGFFDDAREDFRQPCDPSAFDANGIEPTKLAAKLRATCFTPSISAVVTMSAPQALLTGSLFSLLISLGIYLGFTWTRDLDPAAGTNDSRNVFIMYATSLGVCLVVYTLSLLIQDEDSRSEMSILNQYVVDYVQNEQNKETVENWGYAWEVQNGVLRFKYPNAASVNTDGGPDVHGGVASTEGLELVQRPPQAVAPGTGSVV
jgi:hypothetical protein